MMNQKLSVGRIDVSSMFDMHSHILWGMDDGAKSIENSIAMGSISYNEGVHTIVATPHFRGKRDPQIFLSHMAERIELLIPSLKALGIDIEILPGAEVYMDVDVLDSEYLDRLSLAGSRYILIELPTMEVPSFTHNFIYELQLRGFIPIIAHPERNRAIMKDPNLLYNIVDAGCLAQITAGSIYGLFGSKVRECAKVLLTHQMIHMVGTDAHSEEGRAPYMLEARDIMLDWIDEKKVTDILYNIPQKIVEDESMQVVPPLRYEKKKKRFFWFFNR